MCAANILVFYFSAIRRDIDLKYIQDTYMVVLNSLKNTFIGQGHRDSTLFFERAVISPKLSHRKCTIFFVDTSLYALSNETLERAEK